MSETGEIEEEWRPELRGRSFLIVLLAGLVILWLAQPVIGPFVVAAVLAYALSPLVSEVEERTRLPRIVIIGLGYLVSGVVLAAIGYLVIGKLAAEFEALAAAGPDAVAKTVRGLVGADTINLGTQQISVTSIATAIQSGVAGVVGSPENAVQLAGRVGETLLQALLALIATFYFLADGRMFRDWMIALLPTEHRARTVKVLGRIHAVLGKWLRGQLVLVVLVAAVVYVVLGPLFQIPHALAIGVLTGILEVVPLVGPLVATVVAATTAFAHGGAGLAVAVIVFYFVLRQVEDQVVMPQVVGRAVHLHPIVTIFAVLLGLSLYGVLGGLLGVPIAAAVNVIFREFARQKDFPD